MVPVLRSLRENQPAAEWKEAEEEEDDGEEEHFESVLQRVLQLWDSSWANAGKDMDPLCEILEDLSVVDFHVTIGM